ncbi:MAG: Rrf2 family transcriptional regulator [SAR324 cluster bacterium]|nr:Rrf2 family transcriptional regulator [SAR324 cluster bacterium]
MLRLSKKTDYAIILLSHLAVNSDPVSAQELAGVYHLPHPMVANILKLLASSGIIESKRGQQGGYSLTHNPDDLSMAEIIRVTDASFNLVECALEKVDTDNCKISQWCPTQDPLIALHKKIESFMESLTLSEVTKHPHFKSYRRSGDETAHLP